MNTLLNNIKNCNDCKLCMLEINTDNVIHGFGKLLPFYRKSYKNKTCIIGLNPSFRRFPGIYQAFGGEVEHDGSGDKFIKMLKELNLLDKVYITNMVKCSTITNKVSIKDINSCFKWLDKEIELIKPKKIICLGNAVYDVLKDTYLNTTVIKIPHPSYCISYKKITEEKYKEILANEIK